LLEPIRILLADLPPLLREKLKQAIANQPDMQVVGDVTSSFELLLATGETQADVVIIGLEESKLPGVCSHLLSEYPDVKIRGVDAGTSTAFLYEVRTRLVRLVEVSAEVFISAVRAAVRPEAI